MRRPPPRPLPPCIYCGNPADGVEHWVPRSLGSFRGIDPLRERLCDSCNKRLGREIMDEFAHASPEAVLREILKVPGRRRARSVDPFYFRAATDHPVRILARPPDADHDILWQGPDTRGGDGRPLTHVVLRDSEGVYHLVPISPGWTPEQFERAIDERALRHARVVEVYGGSEAEGPRLKRIVMAVFPDCGDAEYFTPDGKRVQQTLQFMAIISVRYARALAAMALHFTLKVHPAFDGHSGHLEPLRRFIANGVGEWRQFVAFSTLPFVAELRDGRRPSSWGHLWALDAAHRAVAVKFQFFVGPQHVPAVWTVSLGTNPGRIEYRFSHGLFLRYFDDQEEGLGFDGEALELAGIRLVRP